MIDLDKRWRRRREAWVTPRDVFRPVGYAVDVIPEKLAKTFVCEHHYAGTFPAARLSVGLFGPGAELVGVAVFSEPMNRRVIPSYTGLDPAEGAELGRFVCLPSVGFNGESWFLARAFPLVASEKGVRGIVSYADPLERTTIAGELMKRQHWGTIYQATNAVYAGRSAPRWLVLAPDGTVVSGRSLSKIRLMERGWEYAMRQLLAYGAPPREWGEAPADWLQRALASPVFRRVRHPGNLAYVFGTDRAAMRRIRQRHRGGLPYENQHRRIAVA